MSGPWSQLADAARALPDHDDSRDGRSSVLRLRRHTVFCVAVTLIRIRNKSVHAKIARGGEGLRASSATVIGSRKQDAV